MTEPKKKPPLALVALSPIAGIYSAVSPYLYWRLAVWLWGTGEVIYWSTGFAVCAQAVAALVYLSWRSGLKP
jgi:hypothetical protein